MVPDFTVKADNTDELIAFLSTMVSGETYTICFDDNADLSAETLTIKGDVSFTNSAASTYEVTYSALNITHGSSLQLAPKVKLILDGSGTPIPSPSISYSINRSTVGTAHGSILIKNGAVLEAASKSLIFNGADKVGIYNGGTVKVADTITVTPGVSGIIEFTNADFPALFSEPQTGTEYDIYKVKAYRADGLIKMEYEKGKTPDVSKPVWNPAASALTESGYLVLLTGTVNRRYPPAADSLAR